MSGHQRRGQRIANVILNSPPLQSGNCQKRAVVPVSKDRKSRRRLKFLSCPINQAETDQCQEAVVEARNKRFEGRSYRSEGVALSDCDVFDSYLFDGCAATNHWITFHRLDREGGLGPVRLFAGRCYSARKRSV